MSYYKCPSYDNTILDFPTIEAPISGSIVTFNTSLATQLFGLKVGITAQQSGTGTPTPQNVRNISGFDSVHVNYVNFNQLVKNGNFVNTDNWTPSSSSVVSLSASDNELSVATSADGNYYATQSYGELTGGHKLLFAVDAFCANISGNDDVRIYTGATSSSAINFSITQANKWNSFATIFERGSGATNNQIRLISRYSAYTTKFRNCVVYDLTQMFGSTIADYLYSLSDHGLSIVESLFYKDHYAYNAGGSLVTVASVNGDTYPDSCVINLGDTYYGGVVDIKNGTATITHKAIKVKDLTWSKGSGGNTTRFYSGVSLISDIKVPDSTSSEMPDIKAESYATVAYFNRLFYDDLSIGINTNKAINITDSNYTTADDFKTAMGECLIVYPLETPIELTGLTADNFTTLVGKNHIFADRGDILELQYIETVQEYLNKHNTI